MSTNDIIEALEEVNMDYIRILNSNEYRLGKNIIEMKYLFSRRGAKKIKRFLIYLRNRTKTKQKCFYKKGHYINSYYSCIVYTCITNKYDKLLDPIYISPNTQYICFTDDMTNNRSEVWSYRNTNKMEVNANRYYKLNPFDVIEKCDFSIYIDGRVQVVSDIRSILSIAKESKTGIAMHYHSARNDVYDEARACIAMNKGNSKHIKELIIKYKKEGMPRDFGLYEATVVVVDHNNPNAKMIMNKWWEEFKSSQSGRDQLSLPYCIWKLGFRASDVGCLGNCKEENPIFRMNKHLL